jgi:hypothetical protein
MSSAARLTRRVSDLDEGSGDPARDGIEAKLAHFITVLQQVVPPGQPPDPASTDLISAAEADRIQRRSSLLADLASRVPQITDGPLDQQAQYWVATGRPSYLPARDHVPRESSFTPVTATAGPLIGAKPFGAGLFTATGVEGGYGMWRCYLRGYENSASLYPRPWKIWRLQPRPGVRVYEVHDATSWVELITAYPRMEGGFAHPGWAAIASDWDAIHITLRAVTAAQGLSLATPYGPAVPPYWDVESTFWLSWRFATITLAGQADAPAS